MLVVDMAWGIVEQAADQIHVSAMLDSKIVLK